MIRTRLLHQLGKQCGLYGLSLQLFMALLWIIHQLMTLFLFWNLTSLRLQEQIEQLTTLRSSFSGHPYPQNTETVRAESAHPSARDPNTDPNDPGDLDLPSDTELPYDVLLRSPLLPDSDISGGLTSSNEYMEVAEQYMEGGGAQPRRQQSVPALNRHRPSSRHSSQRPSSAEPYPRAHGSPLRTHDYGTVSLTRGSLRVASEEQGAQEQTTVNDIPPNGTLQPTTSEGVAVVRAGHSMSYYANG